MLRTIAIIFGIAFFVAGILGFIPSFTPNHELFTIFHVNALHNLIHLATGIIAFWVGCVSKQASRLFFQLFGIICAIFAISGFFYGSQPILGVIANNYADAWLYLLIALIALYLGFKSVKKQIEL
ncbi:MAG: DUF4383 domain-containing protein [Anaerolineae bacterium]